MSKTNVDVRRGMLIWIPIFVLIISSTFLCWAISGARVTVAAGSGSSPVNIQESALLLQSLRVFVHPDDIYPLVERVRPGRLMLRAENRRQADVVLVLEKVVPGQANQAVTAIRARAATIRTSQEVNVGEGEYVFYEESRPEIRGTLIVKPR
jgi:hypothetical protein